MVDPQLARQAKRLADDAAFRAVIDRLDADAIQLFRTSAPEDSATRERAYVMQAALVQIEQEITTWANTVA